jgi:hypothetical protein
MLRHIGGRTGGAQKPVRSIVPNIRKVHLCPQRPGAWFSPNAVGFILNRNFKIKVPWAYCNKLVDPLQKRSPYFGFRGLPEDCMVLCKSLIGK